MAVEEESGAIARLDGLIAIFLAESQGNVRECLLEGDRETSLNGFLGNQTLNCSFRCDPFVSSFPVVVLTLCVSSVLQLIHVKMYLQGC